MSSRTYHGELSNADAPRAVSLQQRADAEIAKFWHQQDRVQRAKITHRALEPRWLRVLAVVVGSLMCGAFARVLLTPGAGLQTRSSAAVPAQPSAASSSLHIDTRPWWHVFADAVPMGKTPQRDIQLRAQPGKTIERVEPLEK